jgi:hypothetical protein
LWQEREEARPPHSLTSKPRPLEKGPPSFLVAQERKESIPRPLVQSGENDTFSV